MNFNWKTNDQMFLVHEASLFKKFAKTDYHKGHAEEYFIIFNITDPQNIMFDKTRTEPTSMFLQKQYMIDWYNPYLMTELDFADKEAANEFRAHFISLTLNQSTGLLAPSAFQDAIVFCPDRFDKLVKQF